MNKKEINFIAISLGFITGLLITLQLTISYCMQIKESNDKGLDIQANQVLELLELKGY